MTAVEWLHATYTTDHYYIRPRAICQDGFSISIQAGSPNFYCTPRQYVDEYVLVELGYPSREIPNYIKPYAETKEYFSTVYPYVPIVLVNRLVAEHGGILELPQEKIE